MKLMDIIQLDEEKIMAVLRDGQKSAIFKNPTPEEINKIALNGVVKGILTPTNFIGFDFQNVQLRDLPKINGFPVNLFFASGKQVSIELMHNIKIGKDQFNALVSQNLYLKQFDVKQVIWHDETE